MFSRALACLLALTLCACAGGASFLGPGTGTVTGHVQIRACGGAYRPEQTGCPTRPMAGAKLTFQLINTSSVSTITTDTSGSYRIDLKPGTYSVRPAEGVPARQGFSGPTTVAVVAGNTVTADFIYTVQLL